MTQEHSPLPFAVKTRAQIWRNAEDNRSALYIQDSDLFAVARVDEIFGPLQNKANAAYIVRACNYHERLVEALEKLTRCFGEDESCQNCWMVITEENPCVLHIAETLLAELDGE